jgi:predicted Zn-dependent protease
VKSLLQDFSGEAGRDVFWEMIGSESVHEVGHCNGIRLVNFAASNIQINLL